MYILQYHAFFQSVKSRNIFFVKQKKVEWFVLLRTTTNKGIL